jgi:hypothetical protein
VKIEAKCPERQKLAEALNDTSISILNCIVNSVNDCTSESELETVYESVEDVMHENWDGKPDLTTLPLFKELEQKIKEHANVKNNSIQILNRFLRFTLTLKNKYCAEFECRQGCIRLELTFSTEEGYELYMKDFESGEIEKQIHSVLLYPPYLANFDLHAEDLTIQLSDSK